MLSPNPSTMSGATTTSFSDPAPNALTSRMRVYQRTRSSLTPGGAAAAMPSSPSGNFQDDRSLSAFLRRLFRVEFARGLSLTYFRKCHRHPETSALTLTPWGYDPPSALHRGAMAKDAQFLEPLKGYARSRLVFTTSQR